MDNFEKKNLLGLSREEIEKTVQANNWPTYRAQQIYTWIYRGIDTIDEMLNLPLSVREELNKKYKIYHLQVIDKIDEKKTRTTKYLLRTEDDLLIEAVLLRYKHGNSLCVSSQAGCNMACVFCASAVGGLKRDLSVAEMLSQVYVIEKNTKEKISNIVMMGSGEPLDNYENTLRFLHLISDKDTKNISKRNITVSTCGIADKIVLLADSGAGVHLSVSLHTPFQEQREKMMPVAKKITLEELMQACRYYAEKTKRRVTFEYALIADINDTAEHAHALARLVKGMNCLINLIPVNAARNAEFKSSGEQAVAEFAAVLTKHHVTTTIRRTLGSSINAACGQLKSGYYKEG